MPAHVLGHDRQPGTDPAAAADTVACDDDVTTDVIRPSWGHDVTRKAVVALAAFAALLQDLAITVGAQTLEDLALALFGGILAGTYSSIFIAVPLLVRWERWERIGACADGT
ncbi:hypothetical protein [Jiangella sp. DSM 45060]|uniref:hypothetical protein n=1 Tax=Jiangella sp. DSM 45060 TaxID=1798224 RepID=UPI000B89409B|nr:hypothetical protein [Jiangella sp. DSM 45060]